MQIVSESFIKWLGENEHLSVKIFKQIIANYDRNRVLTVNYSGAIYEQSSFDFDLALHGNSSCLLYKWNCEFLLHNI